MRPSPILVIARTPTPTTPRLGSHTSRPVGTWWQELKPTGRAGLVAACLFAVLITVGAQVQRHREGQRPVPPSLPISPHSPEARLAAIQLGHRPLPSNPTVERLAGLLDLLEADCPGNTRRDLAAFTVNSLRKLQNRGISATPRDVLGGVAGADDIGWLSDCSAYFESYVTLRGRDPTNH